MIGESGRGLSGLPGRLLAGAIVLLLAAWAVSEAVSLIASVWIEILIIATVVGLVVGLIAWLRSRRQGW